RAAVDVVLHAVAGEDPRVPVIELDWEVTCELPLDLAQDLSQPGLEPYDLRRLVELRLRGAPFIRLDGGFQLEAAHISTDDRGYSASGSQITLMHSSTPALNAR